MLRLTGEIDMEVEADMTAWLREVMSQHPGRDVVVDLAGVSFVDSSGIACLMIAYRQAAAGGVSLTVTGAQGPVLMVLKVTGVLGVLSGTNNQATG